MLKEERGNTHKYTLTGGEFASRYKDGAIRKPKGIGLPKRISM